MEKIEARNDVHIIFMKLILLDRCVPYLPFFKYNIQLCKLFFIYYVFHLLWINKLIVTF